MDKPTGFALTGKFEQFCGRIVSPATLRAPIPGSPLTLTVRAVWDTGASRSLLSRRVADLLSLSYIGQLNMRTPFNAEYKCDCSQVDVIIVLGASFITLPVVVADCPHSDRDCDLLLGLDFITLGDFALSHYRGELYMSFVYPPIGAPINYVELAADRKQMVTEFIPNLEDEDSKQYRTTQSIKDKLTTEEQ